MTTVTTMLPSFQSKGVVDAASGYAHFTVRFQALVVKPFKGEVLDAVVSLVNPNGFFAEAGPIQIFVSQKQMPADMTFQSHGNPAFVNSDGSVTITKDDEVRIKIVGTRYDTNEIFSIGSIAGNYLGPIS
jgi:DNA-directed RNA polymerase II subunit RPB7